MDRQSIVDSIAAEVKSRLTGEGSGHDWWHIARVRNMAKRLAAEERADLFIVELGALLHDIADWKFYDGDESAGPRVARELLSKYELPPAEIDHICTIVGTIGYKGAGVPTPMHTIEGQVVQDADRLDAIGAIGIARTFAYSGHKNRAMHDPESKPELHQSKQAYFKGGQTTINHFYEKLLLLMDRMNTATAKRIAQQRHAYMETFLQRFYEEWDGND